MSGFTKLVPEIVQSSIWNESSDVRIVWITLLAIKDEHGFVRGNAQTIARIANVTLKAANTALARFQEPDPSSNTPDNEGRRIAPIPGGWCVLNHSLYRGKTYNEYEAERKKKYRDEKQAVSETCPGHVPSVSASASVSASEEGMQGEKPGDSPKPVKASYGELKSVRLTDEEHKSLLEKHGADKLARGIEILDGYIASKNKKYASHYAVMKADSWVWDRVKEVMPTAKPRNCI